MKKYSTFNIVKKLKINRNTLQSAINGGFITASIQQATRKGEKNIFSLLDVYWIFLFFKLVEFGISRSAMRDSFKVSFENVGAGSDDYKFYSIKYSQSADGSMVFKEGTLLKQVPQAGMDENDLVIMNVNLAALKAEVDRLIE